MLITSPFCPTMFEFVCMMMSSDVHSALLFACCLAACCRAGRRGRPSYACRFIIRSPGRDAASFGHRPHLTYWDGLLTYSVTLFGRPAAYFSFQSMGIIVRLPSHCAIERKCNSVTMIATQRPFPIPSPVPLAPSSTVLPTTVPENAPEHCPVRSLSPIS